MKGNRCKFPTMKHIKLHERFWDVDRQDQKYYILSHYMSSFLTRSRLRKIVGVIEYD